MALSDFFFDPQNPNPNVNTNRERQMGDVLCILSSCRVFIIDMDYILRDEDYIERTPLKWLPVKRTLNFLNSGLFLGMGLAKWRNSLYMFGGYNPSQSDAVGPDNMFDRFKVRAKDLPRPAYMLDLTDDQSEPVRLSSMSGPKLFPIVEAIEDKIYVLSKVMLTHDLPMFEVFDPKTLKWRTLPPILPPSSPVWKVEHSSVRGSVITCVLSSYYGVSFCCFNTITEQWEYPEEIESPYADPPKEDVSMGENDEFWATDECCYPKGDDGYALPFEFSDIFPSLCGTFRRWDYVKMADTSDQMDYKCGLVQYFDYEGEAALHIMVFRVEKLEPDKVPGPGLIRYLRRQVYAVKSEDEQQQPDFDLKKVFIGRVSYNIQTGSSKCSSEEQGGKEDKKRKREEEKEP